MTTNVAAIKNQDSSRKTRAKAAGVYYFCDVLTEATLYVMVVLTPWLFGSAERWATWTMNGCAFFLGALFFAKALLRATTRLRPNHWDFHAEAPGSKFIARALGWTTVLLLAYLLLGAVNARATFHKLRQEFVYHDFISWLPHSYDRAASFFWFWTFLGLACVFWSLWEWLPGKTLREFKQERNQDDTLALLGLKRPAVPERLKRLLWVISINGALVALVSVLQLIGASEKILWTFESKWSRTDQISFGPYPYRGNAAQYFNLVWPVAFGLWWTTRQSLLAAARRTLKLRDGPHSVLLPAVVLLAAAPIISLSRGGALIAMILFGILVFAQCFRREVGPRIKIVLVLAFSATLGIGLMIAGPNFFKRLETLEISHLGGRGEIRENAQKIVDDFPVYGTGAGSFSAMYNIYRAGFHQPWHGYLHNDWLQTRVSLGWVGFALSLLALGLVLARWWVPGGLVESLDLVGPLWVAIIGCMVHATFDFPFQIYSILFLFTVYCAILFSISRRPPHHT